MSGMWQELKYEKNPILDVINTILLAVLDVNMKSEDINKSLLYFNSESACGEAIKVIKKILPPRLQGLVACEARLPFGTTSSLDSFNLSVQLMLGVKEN